MPLFVALSSLVVIPMLVRRLHGLPDRMSPGYDPAQTPIQARSLKLVIGSQVLLPVMLYLILNVIMPQEGALVLF